MYACAFSVLSCAFINSKGLLLHFPFPFGYLPWDFDDLSAMHLSSISSFKLIWLLLPAFSVAATLPVTVGGSTTIGTGPINLVTPQQPQNTTLDHDKKAYCKHDDDYHHNFIYNSSRGLPFPDFSRSEVIVRSADDHPFDCFLELLDGYVTLEVCRTVPTAPFRY